MTRPPRVAIGMPLFNGEEHVAEAIESLLGQTFEDFAVVLVDDGSTDATETIAARYLPLDDRLRYERNPERLGMVANWRLTFTRARELHGNFDYFAWGSDHDVWHPRFLEVLTETLDDHPKTVAAYPLSLGFTEGDAIVREPFRFDTSRIASRARRLALAQRRMVAGYMVYGLFRAPELERSGIYRSVLLPDRLLFSELCLYGELRQAPEILWYRRFRPGMSSSLRRQRASFFPRGAPTYAHIPWPLQHAGALGMALVVGGAGRPKVSRSAGVLLTLNYLRLSTAFELRRRLARRINPYRKRLRKRTARSHTARALYRAVMSRSIVSRRLGRVP
jgi:glycosyltransferase involved in cell wall biosynthesis